MFARQSYHYFFMLPVISALGFVGGSGTAYAQCELDQIAASDADQFDGFGVVAMEGDWLVVGAPNWDCDPLTTFQCGAVYVYRRDINGTPQDFGDDIWIEHVKLAPASLVAVNRLGTSVAISGDVIVAGAPGVQFPSVHPGSNDVVAGAAFVFRRNASGTPSDLSDDVWTHEATLVEPVAYQASGFGDAVAVDGTVIVVGAPNDTVGASACCVPSATPGCGDTTCEGSLCAFPALFCCNTAWDENCVSGASQQSCLCTKGAGAVHVFQHNGSAWSQTARLVSSDSLPTAPPLPPGTPRLTGFSVSISGDWVVAGTNGNAIYVFRISGGTVIADVGQIEHQRFEGPPFNPNFHQFGLTVSIDGDWLVTGDRVDDGDCTSNCNRGLVYVYRRTDGGTPLDTSDDVWVLHETLEPADLGNTDQLGWPVYMRDDLILATAGSANPPGCNWVIGTVPCGVVYMFRRDDAGTPEDLTDDLWVESGKLGESPPTRDSGFSKSITADGPVAVIGAPNNDDPVFCGGEINCGAVHTFVIAPDTDNDTLVDACDNCAAVSNIDQADTDLDGIGDVCEACCSVAAGEQMIRRFCISGVADGTGYSWRLSGPGFNFEALNPPAVPAGGDEAALVEAFVSSINEVVCQNAAALMGDGSRCFSVSFCHGDTFDLEVGQQGQSPDCAVTESGCTYNPMIQDMGAVPAVSQWGLVTLVLTLIVGATIILQRTRHSARTHVLGVAR